MSATEHEAPYSVRALTADDVLPAFSVVRTVKPDVALDAWQAHVDDVLDYPVNRRQGVMLLTGPNGTLYGLFSYRAVSTLGAGRTLQLDDFCVAPVMGRHSATGALLAEAETLARRFDCSRMASPSSTRKSGRTRAGARADAAAPARLRGRLPAGAAEHDEADRLTRHQPRAGV